jgi:dolichyl-phosphate beta-glucosyltransferase
MKMNKSCIIIPCLNEEFRINTKTIDTFASNNKMYDIIFIDDGSYDNTLSILKKLSLDNENIYYISYNKNKGKSYAVKKGVELALKQNDYKYIGFIDADLPLKIFDELHCNAILNKEYSFLYFIKDHKNFYKKNKYRKFQSWVLKIINRLFFKINVKDTQFGCKIFKKNIALLLFDKNFKSKWLFDIELFLRFDDLTKHTPNLCALGVQINDINYNNSSNISFKTLFVVIIDYLKIIFYYKFK